MENRKRDTLSAIFIALSHVAGLIRVILVSLLFGSSTVGDLLSYTFSFSNQARKKIEDGSGNLALLRLREEDRGRPLFLILFHLLMLLLVFLFSDPIFSVLFKHSNFSSQYFTLGARLYKSFFVFIIVFSLSSAFNSYIIRAGNKALSSFLITLPSLFSIAFLLLFHKRDGALSFSNGLLFGSLAYLALSLAFYYKSGMRIHLKLTLDRVFFKSYLTSSLLIVFSIFEVLPLFIASSEIEMASLYFSNSFTIALLPYSFILEVFTIIYYPEIAKTKGNERRLKCVNAFSYFFFFALSISLLLFSFSNEISSFLFLSSSYGEIDVINTANILKLLSLSLIPLSLLSFFQRIMFIELDNRSSLLSTLIKISISYILLISLKPSLYKSSFIFLFSSLITFIITLFLIRGIRWEKMWRKALTVMISSLPLIALSFIKYFYRLDVIIKGKLPLLAVSLLIGMSIFALSLVVFRLIERPRYSSLYNRKSFH